MGYCLISVSPELLHKFRQEKKRRKRHYADPSQSAHLNRMMWISEGLDIPWQSCQGYPSPSSPCMEAEPALFHPLSHCGWKSHVNAKDPCFLLVFKCQAVQQLNHKQFSHARVELTSAGQDGYSRALSQARFDRLSSKEACAELLVTNPVLKSSFSFFLAYNNLFK